MASAYTGSTMIPMLVGLSAGMFGLTVIPIVILALFVLMFISSVLVR